MSHFSYASAYGALKSETTDKVEGAQIFSVRHRGGFTHLHCWWQQGYAGKGIDYQQLRRFGSALV